MPWLALLARRKVTLVGAALLALMLTAGLSAPFLAGNPTRMDVSVRLSRPSATHWFGTDDVGRDVFSRVVYGARLSLMVGTAVVTLSLVVGVSCGLVAGYYRALDNGVMRVMDRTSKRPARSAPPISPSSAVTCCRTASRR